MGSFIHLFFGYGNIEVLSFSRVMEVLFFRWNVNFFWLKLAERYYYCDIKTEIILLLKRSIQGGELS